jgi:hypothetical protein
VGASFGDRFAGQGVDTVFLHPFPVFLIKIRPFCAEFCAAVSGFYSAYAATEGVWIMGEAGDLAGCGPTASGVPPACSCSSPFAFSVCGAHATCCHFFTGHEREESCEDRRDFPSGVKRFGVEVGDAEAETRARLETTAGGMHADSGGCIGVVGGEY